jgi:5-methyltetrahydropteroyltriglutamate--homocysteine methyltransferase
MTTLTCYLHSGYPHSEALVAVAQDVARRRRPESDLLRQRRADQANLEALQREAGLAYISSRMLGWQDLFRSLAAACPRWGLGVLDVHTDFVEPPELLRDRILYAVKVFGGPQRLQIMPDCGLRTRSWEIACRKLTSMTAGVRLARAALGL